MLMVTDDGRDRNIYGSNGDGGGHGQGGTDASDRLLLLGVAVVERGGS